MTKEERAQRKAEASSKYPWARLPGSRCDIRMAEGDPDIEVCFHGGPGGKAEIRYISIDDLLTFRNVISAMVSRYNAKARLINSVRVDPIEAIKEI